MADILMRACEKNYPQTQYRYRIENQAEKAYESGLNRDFRAYNHDMKRKIIFWKNNNVDYQKIEQYFKSKAKKFANIQIDDKKLGGMPTVKKTRIPVSLIVACLKDEMTFQEICEEYKIAPEDVEKVMEAIGNFLKSKGDSIKNTYYAVKKKGDSYEIIRRFPKL